MSRPLVLIDIAVPRDIEPEVRDCPGIALYDMDDLQRAVARNLAAREAEATEARVLVGREVARFERWLGTRSTCCPPSPRCASAARRWCDQVLRENGSRWESLSAADRERLETMARAMVSRLLHEPTLRLKDRPARTTRTGTCTRSASCSRSTRSSPRRRSHRGPRSRRSRRAAAARG